MTPHQDRTDFIRPSHLSGLEVVTGRYAKRSFPLHAHPEYVVGVITKGVEALSIRGARHVIGRGHALLINPDEAHANEAIGDETLEYRVLYIQEELFAASGAIPEFNRATASSPAFFEQFLAVHSSLAIADDKLSQQSAFIRLAEALNGLLCGQDDWPAKAAQSRSRLNRVRDYIDAHFSDDICIDELAALSDLSPFHMVRTFKSDFGLSPIAYRNQRRVMKARRLLCSGQPIADIAVSLGFADQSHFTRQFAKIMGTTPGRYGQQ